jgi:membrane protease YdiL (CAAX protease family)
MLAFIGRGAVLSMAVVYCSLHFGKPMGEAISSVVGGYILGVIAFETRSVWGGVIVHMGIAWLMETVAFLQKL